MNSIRSLVVASAVAAAGGLACAEGVTYYACGGGTKNSFSYDWATANNWRLDGANGTQVPETPPQAGDIVIFDKSISYMSAAPDGTTHPALQKILFNVGNTIHQGYISLKTGGEGLVLKDGIGMSWWAGIRFVGAGEVPIHVPNGQTFGNQKGVQDDGQRKSILVKTGGGTFCTANQGKNVYYPCKTLLVGGTFAPRVNHACTGHEFVWASNEGGLRLKLQTYSDDPSWTIQNGAMIESNVVDNTTHGISTDYSAPCYLHLTGTPKVPEQRFTGQLYNTAGIDFAPGAKQADQSDYLFTIAKSVSSAGGGLKVSNGTMRLSEGASFTSLRLVNVGAGGTFKIEEGSGKDFLCQSLEVAQDGKLDLAAGVTLNALSLTVAGQKLAYGTYSAAGGEGQIAASWIEGEGSVFVNPIAMIDPIVLTVDEGTKTLAEALADYNAAHGEEEGFTSVTVESLNGGADKGRTLVKEGAGTLNMDVAIASYTGAIEARAGFLKCSGKNTFGKDDSTSHVNVCSGAAVIIGEMTKENRDFNVNRTFHVAGTGPDGQGALRTGTTFLDYGTQSAAGGYLIVEADALVRHGNWYFLPNNDVTLNGHTLTYKQLSGNDSPVFIKTVKDDGKIVLDGSSMRYAGITLAGTNPNNTIEIKNYGGWRFWGSQVGGAGKAIWKAVVSSGEGRIYGDTTQTGRESANNTFWNPWELKTGTTLNLTSQNNNPGSSANMRGKVFGPGNILLGEGSSPKYLHLLNAQNDFSGLVRIDRGIVDIYEPGTLPKAATLQLERTHTFGNQNAEATMPAYYGAAFVSPLQQDLGACVLKGDYIGRVQGGLGRFTSVTKSGKNTIEYFTQLGGGLLEVTGGTLKFPRGAAPGLWEGTNYSANVATDFAGTALATNLVMRGPHTANAVYTENYTPSAANRLMTYSGYIWNRTGSDETWTFVSSVNGPVKIKIDGEEVLSTTAAALQKAQKTLTPGAHTFEYRSYNGSPRSTDWVANKGFAYDVTGAADPAAASCALCIDPGDGSLFTRSTDSTDLPAFDAIHVATGATLDLNGNAYVANDICGAGTVASSATDASAKPKLVVKAMTIDAAKNEALNVNVPVEFDAAFTVNVTNVANRLRIRHTILTANAALTLPENVTVSADDGSNWSAGLSADGRSLELVKTGLGVILR